MTHVALNHSLPEIALSLPRVHSAYEYTVCDDK